jgi:hypothetical protein
MDSSAASIRHSLLKITREGWISKGYYGLDQGPVVIMIENYLSGFLWNLMKKCPYVVSGLQRAGFKGGWL